jgi:ferredoxin-NADP reductase
MDEEELRIRTACEDPALIPYSWVEAELVSVTTECNDTIKMKFKSVDEHANVGLPTGQHVLLRYDDKNRSVVRPYTPIKPSTLNEDDGTLDMVVKIYKPNQSSMFQQGGFMSQHLGKMQVGDRIMMKGPAGHIMYPGNGTFVIHGNSLK